MTLTIESRIKLNDGMTMPLFGLGVWRLESGKETRDAVSYALGTWIHTHRYSINVQ